MIRIIKVYIYLIRTVLRANLIYVYLLSFSTIYCAGNQRVEETIKENESEHIYLNFIYECSDAEISEFLKTKNPRFAILPIEGVFSENKDICTGTHVDSEEKFCSNSIPRSSHIPIYVKKFETQGKYNVQFEAIENMFEKLNETPSDSKSISGLQNIYIEHQISIWQFNILENFMLKDYDLTMLDVLDSDIEGMWIFIDFLGIKPSLDTDWFFVKFFKKYVLLTEVYKKYLLELQPDWFGFFTGVYLDSEDNDGILLGSKIVELPSCPKTEEDIEVLDPNDTRSEEVRRYGDEGFVLEDFTDQCYSRNMSQGIYFKNNIGFKIVTDAIQKLHNFCSFKKYKQILAIFLGSRIYKSLEVTNINFEPPKKYRLPNYDTERINITFNFDGMEPSSTHNTLKRVFISDSFKKIKELNLNMVSLGELDANRLYDLRCLVRLKIKNPNCKEIQRSVSRLIRCNINLKVVNLFQIIISRWFIESISKILLETIIFKKCNLETDRYNQVISLSILPKDAKFVSTLKKFVLEGYCKYSFEIIEHLNLYTNLEFLSLNSCFRKKISKLKNLKVLKIIGNTFFEIINFQVLNTLENLKELTIASYLMPLENVNILRVNQGIQSLLFELSLCGFKIDNATDLKCLIRFNRLKKLDLSDSPISFNKTGIVLLPDETYLPTSLEVLILDNLKFSSSSIIYLVNGLKNLKKISMKGFKFHFLQIYTSFFEILTQIEEIDFSNCDFDNISPFIFQNLKSLRVLRLFNAKVKNDSDIWEFLNSLPRPQGVTDLSLGNVRFYTPSIIKATASTVVHKSNLTEVYSFFQTKNSLKVLSLHLVVFEKQSISRNPLECFCQLDHLYVGYDALSEQSEQLNILKENVPPHVLKIFKCTNKGSDISKVR
ncbi:hypothetical protein CWI37_0573p0010 [Hamiltosporidium tvaerminnensis]|uniref:Uncharacterized protein n=1 Tax=Hamiltosporidium tvaerminnensis TaxID=1176355 RepID=A0A4Q9L3F4_9MICR|nr:hypothetical protein CWI37_0573p0010 [Hamiltosporidium tvaerminnensis]